jgi:hypothetical protein
MRRLRRAISESPAERRSEIMFQTYEKRTRNSLWETTRALARQFAVVIATLALFGSLYLVILIGQ